MGVSYRKAYLKIIHLFLCFALIFGIIGCTTETSGTRDITDTVDIYDIPEYSGYPYVEINSNIPFFDLDSMELKSGYEYYGELDELGRCTVATAVVGTDTMPDEPREAIGHIKPSGWHLVKYDFIDGKYLYNRCHLIGFQLTAENSNEKNLITGTRYLNVTGMLPFEEKVADYVKKTDNHVLYRVTPLFDGDNLLASGVIMEAYSLEDDGEGICFCVFCYNVQPGIIIDYSNGDNSVAGDTDISGVEAEPEEEECDYVLNTNTRKFHRANCSSVEDIKEKNKEYYRGTRDDIINMGFEPCKKCNP